MTPHDWHRLALAEDGTTLHAFNHDREMAFGCPELAEAQASFGRYLEPIPYDPSLSATKILEEFAEHLESRSAGRVVEPDARFVGAPLRTGVRRVLLKSLSVPDEVLDRLGVDHLNFDTKLTKVAEALATHDLTDDLEAKLQNTLASLMAANDRYVPRLRAASRSSAKAPSAPVGHWPWWFSFEDAIETEAMELADPSDPLRRSGYVAGLRCALGLWHPSDHLIQTTTFASRGWEVRYRILFQFRFTPSADEERLMRQPTNFSGGIPCLFVSRPRRADGGVTVRLTDAECGHDANCPCGGGGLPEGVFPTSSFMTSDSQIEITGVYLLLDRDIARYLVPSCDEIRGKCAA